MEPLLRETEAGLYCPQGDFYIDPWCPDDRAVITHGHSDHARCGSQSYLCADPCLPVLRARLGDELRIESLPYGENSTIGGDAVCRLRAPGQWEAFWRNYPN